MNAVVIFAILSVIGGILGLAGFVFVGLFGVPAMFATSEAILSRCFCA